MAAFLREYWYMLWPAFLIACCLVYRVRKGRWPEQWVSLPTEADAPRWPFVAFAAIFVLCGFIGYLFFGVRRH